MMIDEEFIARICHEANRAYCESMGDHSQVSWEDAPEWQKESAKNGVRAHLNHPDMDSEASHISWFREKVENGWKYGPVKDAEKKEHPCLVPYKDLPPEQRIKDELFTAIVNVFRDKDAHTLPPLGVMPKWMHSEMRYGQLTGAVARYLRDGYPVPKEWIDEINELTSVIFTEK